MQTKWIVLTLFAAVCLMPGTAHAINCTGLPTSFTGNEFPNGDFFSNFNNPCYAIPFTVGHGNAKFGDLNATYFQMYFKVDPRYQVIIFGTFPNARYFSVSVYDDHSAYSQSIGDFNIVPLTSQFINPYQAGVSFVPLQQFAMPINFGGTPGKLETGCMMNGYNVDVNALDATQRHAGMDWNSDLGMFAKYPHFVDHVVDTPLHTNPNSAGAILVRAYVDITALNYNTSPHIILRDVASGCAYPADYAMNTIGILTGSATTGATWLDTTQNNAHNLYETSYLPRLCYGASGSQNVLPWSREPQYVPGASPESAYIVATVPSGLPDTLAAAGEVMRVRFRVPTFPPTPCTNGCSRSGTEQMRYESLSFLNPGGATIASLADTYFNQDPNGYVTLIVGTGTPIPSWITQTNGYTSFDLTQISGYQQLNLLDLRQIQPNGGFTCAGKYVPYRTATQTPAGNLMGDYMPVVDYPLASTLPQKASPATTGGSCDVFPTGQPGALPNCGTFNPPPIGIAGVMTQCPAPGCTTFAAQPNPPMTITGGGFGNFPNGMPYTGTTAFLQIFNVSQNWSAGFTGDTCTVALNSWASNRIQLTANVNQNGACPLSAGDVVKVKVINPQTAAAATFQVVVAAP
ncbi:MAG: hypothetical protein U0Q18_30240 [Bryobacteraceae bacterium]